MNYEMLEKVICDTIKEEQIKLGYEKETIRLYYPMSSLEHILEEDITDAAKLNEALAVFTDKVKDKLGKLQISHSEDRYCILIPPEGAVYVHENCKDNPFLIDFINVIRNHDCKLEQILAVFHAYSDQVQCIRSEIEDFDYVIYFTDGKLDDYRYCIKFEHGHTIYHRFTRRDFEQLNVTVPEQESGAEEVIDEEKEQRYQNLIVLMKSTKCMTACPQKVDMYKQVAKQLAGMAGYKDTAACAEECRLLAKQAKNDIKKKTYKTAVKKKEEARTADDYNKAAEEFRKLSGYKDSDDLALECDVLSNRMEKRYVRKRIIGFGVTVLCMVVIIIAVFLPQTKYFIGRLYQSTGVYGSAIRTYSDLGTYEDSETRLKDCRYRYGLELLSDGSYAEAVKQLSKADDYKDSDARKVEALKLQIGSCKQGDTVSIGNEKWRILELAGDQALLMKNDSIDPMAYHMERTTVTWESSSLRQWLNSSYLELTFSEAEQSNIVATTVMNSDNPVYGTDGGKDTQDKLFILSIEESEKYQALFPKFKSNTWLRSPGNSGESAAFLSMDGTPMTYGYDVSDDSMKIRPVLWFNLDSEKAAQK